VLVELVAAAARAGALECVPPQPHTSKARAAAGSSAGARARGVADTSPASWRGLKPT
jgi:hypothetical protein